LPTLRAVAMQHRTPRARAVRLSVSWTSAAALLGLAIACGAGSRTVHDVEPDGACRLALDRTKRSVGEPNPCRLLDDATDRGDEAEAGVRFAECDAAYFRADLESALLDAVKRDAETPSAIRVIVPAEPELSSDDWGEGRLTAAVLSRPASGVCACGEYVFRRTTEGKPVVHSVGSRTEIPCDDVLRP
jgi:hypothetical protein